MRLSTFLLPLSIAVYPASAQWEQIQKVLDLVPKPSPVGEDFIPEQGIVHPVDTANYRDVLQFTNVDWLVLFTTGFENCPGCEPFERAFHEAVNRLQDNKDIYFARVDCDTNVVLCSMFGSWGARMYHISHSKTPSKAFPGVEEHNTHVYPVPFHRPDTPPPAPTKDAKGREVRPHPEPDVDWLVEVVNMRGKWKEGEEWTGATNPFDGWAQQPLWLWWYIVSIFSKIPPMAMMVGIGLFSRYITSKYTGKTFTEQEKKQVEAIAEARKRKEAAEASKKKK
ncbi:hypothetical protein TWF694_001801 [Orbilia ellipsospora]|uniref:Thioredoxin domain-containing protein n=1 Tax=Orbilia ellipsospora TaxID=2528407 RepID=A0AAV9X4S8_9PEZI